MLRMCKCADTSTLGLVVCDKSNVSVLKIALSATNRPLANSATDDFDQRVGQRRWLEGNNTYPSKLQLGQFSFD